MLNKNFAGWEIMEVFAGGVTNSDTVFTASIFMFYSMSVGADKLGIGIRRCD